MVSYPLRRLIGWVALAVASLIGITLPLTYAANRLRYEDRLLSFKAELSASRTQRFIYTHAELWQYQGSRLAAVIALPQNPPINQRVTDNRRRVVVDEGSSIDWPRIQVQLPIVVSGVQEGELIAAISLMPTLIDIGGVALASLMLGCLTWLAIRALPLRALDRVLE